MLYGYSVIWFHCIHTLYTLYTDDIYEDITEDVETRFDTSNYELECNSTERPIPKGKNKKVIGLMKDELGRKIMTKFI